MLFFFFIAAAPTVISPLSLHDALPILACANRAAHDRAGIGVDAAGNVDSEDRKSTRLNSSHLGISYAGFCLKKKKKQWPTLCDCLISSRQSRCGYLQF